MSWFEYDALPSGSLGFATTEGSEAKGFEEWVEGGRDDPQGKRG